MHFGYLMHLVGCFILSKYSGRVIGPPQRPLPDNTQHSQRCPYSRRGIRTRNPSKWAAADPRFSPSGHRDRSIICYTTLKINQYICNVTATLPLVNGDPVLMSNRVSSALPTRAGLGTRFCKLRTQRTAKFVQRKLSRRM